MRLIVGLGNPGREYENTRHNSGFIVLDALSDKLKITIDEKKFKGLYKKSGDLLLLKPQTYMNLSGECVLSFVNYFKIAIEDIIVVYDDMDIPLGKIRIRKSGSSAGQKGMQNIIDCLHTKEIKRIRIGIGAHEDIDTKDYVLGKIKGEDQKLFAQAVDRASEALIYSLDHPFAEVMNRFNGQ